MTTIHPTSSISSRSQFGDGVTVGPSCTLTGDVRLGEGVRLIGNVQLQGPISIGAGTRVYPYACLGFDPQDYKFTPGDPTAGVEIGANCVIREYATVHAATRTDRPTRLADGVYMMVHSHIGHDAQVGAGAMLVNGANVGGHAEIGEKATLSACAGIHQFNRIGRLAFVSGAGFMSCELPPFCTGFGRNQLAGLNLVGLRRSGICREEIDALRSAFRAAMWPLMMRAERQEILDEAAHGSALVAEFALFVSKAKRPLCEAARNGAAEEHAY